MAEPVSTTQLQDLSAALAGIVAKAAPSLVSLHARRTRSSGFVWRKGLIITASDALPDDGDLTVILPNGSTIAAVRAGDDPTTDIALLRCEGADLPPLSLSSARIAAGALALAVGARHGAPSAALGIVSEASGPWRSLRGGELDARIELDLAMRRSSEGGLVFDAGGSPIGMAVFGPRRRVLVIPAATVERVAAKLETHGRIARGYLGLSLQPVAVEGGKESGIMVMSVDSEGPGAKAGIRQGDVIVAWKGEPVQHMRGLFRGLGPDSVGQTVVLGVSRAGERRDVSLTVGERPAA